MKYYLFIAAFTAASLTIHAQDTVLIYFDKDWKETSKEKASFYRKKFRNENKQYAAYDYYLNGTLQMAGTFTSKKLKTKEGKFTYYYSNGRKKSEGQYTGGKLSGKWDFWYDNGEQQSQAVYDKGIESGPWQSWYRAGGAYCTGNYEKGLKEGEWKWFHPNGQVSSREIYSRNVATSFEFFDEAGKKIEGANLKIEMMPEFPGGQDSLMNYLKRHIKYPGAAKQAGITGRVSIEFIVGKDGSIEDPFVYQSVNPEMDYEALRVVQGMPNWIPGTQHNLPVRVKFRLPVSFKLK